MTTSVGLHAPATKTLRELMDELELWVEIYVSSHDESSAQVARYLMLKAHRNYRAERKRRILSRIARMRGTGLSPETIASAKSVPIEIVLDTFLGHKLDCHGRGKCPFHDGRNPQSLHKLPSSNRVYCHVCQRSWNPVDAMMILKGISFRKAVRILSTI